MKKILYIIALSIGMSSCDYLDFNETSNQYTQEDMYEYYLKSVQMLTNVYGYIPQDFGVIGGAMRDCATDDSEYADPNGTVQNFTNGYWSAVNTLDTQWTLYYGIRAANEYISSIANANYDRFENNVNYPFWMDKLQYHPYEARILRAHFFFELARRYGDIAMPLTVLTVDEASAIGETKFDDVISFIVSECTECAANLPVTYANSAVAGSEVGRVTKGFALSLKTKALLYAASPLHNSAGDSSKWVAAAEAAKEIIDMGVYSLDPDGAIYSDTGDGAKVSSAEIIIARMNDYNWTFEQRNFPIRMTNNTRTTMDGNFPTQNLVDAFQTTSGYDVTLTELGWYTLDPNFDAAFPYSSRDPRLERTVLVNNKPFNAYTIETFEGGLDDKTRALGGTVTGYFLRKYVQESTSFALNANVTCRHFWVISRYAEIILSYAEAMNEAYGPTYTDATFTMSAIEAVNLVRANVGMPGVAETPAYATLYSSQAGMREVIQREWRVEFAFEDHRFWDIRRWKIASETKDIYGAYITKNADNTFSFKRTSVETRVWSDKMYLYPVPQTELFNNLNLTQNTGW
ncbi:MAG: RagB/SusD family nutrient uptake outer membrane protein [Rikenellaceae bacterium]